MWPPGHEAMTVRPRIILAAADNRQRRRLRVLFEAHGYYVQATATEAEALHALEVSVPQIVVHAPSAEATNGATPEIELTARLRAATSAALIVLTATPGETAVVDALAAGADDAIAPPHARGELIARLELAMRRARRTSERRLHVCGDLILDLESRELTIEDRHVVLTRLEYRLLEELVLAAGHLVSHDDLLTRVWGPAHRGRLQYLRVYIGRLRQKIEQAGTRVPITNVPGLGYRLDREVTTTGGTGGTGANEHTTPPGD
jgi:two-component system KDP operon response regulator KdpE